MEARCLPFVTSRAMRPNGNQDRIVITIGCHRHNALCVAGCGAFVPQLVSRSRPKPRLSSFDRMTQAVCIHVSEHQYVAGICILDYCGNEPALVEFHSPPP